MTLSLEQLHIAFRRPGGWQEVVHGATFSVNPGEILGIVGESGSGKSVTAHAILQLLHPNGAITHGKIIFDGEELHTKTTRQMREVRGRKIGMIFQDPMTALNPTLPIGWQIAEGLVRHECLSWHSAKKYAIDLLHQVGIHDPEMRFKTYPFQLSGGMRQRVLIAIALACRPRLLIADEPTTALDATIQAQILRLLQKIKQETEMSLLLITHDLDIAGSMCDRIGVMHQGKLVELAEAKELLTSPRHPYTQSLLCP